jgi:hypothetical protein
MVAATVGDRESAALQAITPCFGLIRVASHKE